MLHKGPGDGSPVPDITEMTFRRKMFLGVDSARRTLSLVNQVSLREICPDGRFSSHRGRKPSVGDRRVPKCGSLSEAEAESMQARNMFSSKCQVEKKEGPENRPLVPRHVV